MRVGTRARIDIRRSANALSTDVSATGVAGPALPGVSGGGGDAETPGADTPLGSVAAGGDPFSVLPSPLPLRLDFENILYTD